MTRLTGDEAITAIEKRAVDALAITKATLVALQEQQHPPLTDKTGRFLPGQDLQPITSQLVIDLALQHVDGVLYLVFRHTTLIGIWGVQVLADMQCVGEEDRVVPVRMNRDLSAEDLPAYRPAAGVK